MRKTIFICDQCDQEIGKKKHINLFFGQNSGIATPPKSAVSSWTIEHKIQGIKQFCSGKCISAFFTELLKK